MPWRTITGARMRRRHDCRSLQVLLEGVFEKRRFLDLVATSSCSKTRRRRARQEDGRLSPVPRGELALEETLRAAPPDASRVPMPDRDLRRGHEPAASGDRASASSGTRRVGQEPDDGLLRRARRSSHPAMENPTLVVLTDRNDLDDQLFGTFARCHELLRQPPVQAAEPRRTAREAQVASGGVVFTTIQKFFPRRRATGIPCSPTGGTSS